MNILKSLTTVSFITFLSRILGFIRDTLIAQIFGVNITSDAFFVAFRIPNLFRRIFVEGTLPQTFTPIFMKCKNYKNVENIQRLVSYMFGLLILIPLIISAIGMIIAPCIIEIIAPGFIHFPEKFSLTVTMLRIIFPYILFSSLSSLTSIILNSLNQFSIPAFSPILLNISMIIFVLLSKSLFHQSIIALPWSVLMGSILQLSYQLIYLKRVKLLVTPYMQFSHFEIWNIIKKTGPMVVGISVTQISTISNTIFTSYLESGSTSWMYYSDRLIEFPSGIFGATLGTVLLPLLSEKFVKGNKYEYSYLLDWGLRLCCILSIPSAVALYVLSYPLIVTLFQYGKFSALDVLMVQKSLIPYSIGLTGLVATKILTQGFYSCQNIKTPVSIAIMTLLITQIANFILVNLLQHAGLSLSTSIGTNFNALILYWKLRQSRLFYHRPGWLSFIFRLISASLVMATSLIGMLYIVTDWENNDMFWRFFNLTSISVIGIIIYFFMLWILGFRLNQFTILV